MNTNYIKNIVQLYDLLSIEQIEEVIEYIKKTETERLGIDLSLSIEYTDGGSLKSEKNEYGQYQIDIGILPLYQIKEQKQELIEKQQFQTQDNCYHELEQKLLQEEKKEFIELILQTFHELRHVEQMTNIVDNPILNEDTLKMTNEKIIGDVLPGIIIHNYESTALEIDAMITSLYKTTNFFKTMETNITPDEVFQVMKQKELSYLNYDLNNFGETYESAMNYFNQIYCHKTDIQGYESMLNMLSEKEKIIFYNQCQELNMNYNLTTDIEEKWDILVSMALILNPELYNKYPLIQNKNNKNR